MQNQENTLQTSTITPIYKKYERVMFNLEEVKGSVKLYANALHHMKSVKARFSKEKSAVPSMNWGCFSNENSRS